MIILSFCPALKNLAGKGNLAHANAGDKLIWNVMLDEEEAARGDVFPYLWI